MPTYITDAPTTMGLAGSSEHRLDQEPNGTLWLLVVVGNLGKMFTSVDSGGTWAYVAGSDLVLSDGGSDVFYPSMFIDVDGYAHVAWANYQTNPQVINYAFGQRVNAGGWQWTYLSFAAATGRLSSRVDIVAFPEGAARRAFISYSIHGLAGVAAPKVAKIDISLYGQPTLGAAVHGPATTVDAGTLPTTTLTFSHTGDGKTPKAAPDLWLVASTRAETRAVRCWRAAYSGGVWTWAAPVSMDGNSYNVADRVVQAIWTGTILLVSFISNGAGARAPRLFHFDGTTATAHHATAAAGSGGFIAGGWSVDPATGDVTFAGYDTDDGDILTATYDISATTWSGWSTAVVRTATTLAGRLAMLRAPLYEAIPLVYGTDDPAGALHVWSHRLANLARVPEAPILVYPLPNQVLDISAGATFTWRHRPIGPGDVQQAWSFVRSHTFIGIVEWWNEAAHEWETSEFWNVGPQQEAHFPVDTWEHGENWGWGVATKASNGEASPVSELIFVTSQGLPTVVVTSPPPIVYADSTPAIEWTYTYGSPQAGYEVRITADDPAVDADDPSPVLWTSGAVASPTARTVTVDTPLIDETAYIAWVRTQAEDESFSAWTPQPFHLSVNAPPGPDVTTSVVVGDDEVPVLEVAVSGKANHLAADQALGAAGWQARTAGKTVVANIANGSAGILAGFAVTKTGSTGTADFISVEGDPPVAEPGEIALLGPLDFPVEAGVDYTFLAYVFATGTGRSVTLSILWYFDDDIPVPENGYDYVTTGAPVVASTLAYSRVSVSAVAPEGVKRARLVGTVAAATTSDVHYFTRLSFHPGLSLDWQPGGFAESQTLRVERSADEGETWETVASGIGVDYRQHAVIKDWNAPTSVPVIYRAFSDMRVPTISGHDHSIGSDPGDAAEGQVSSPYWILRSQTGETQVVAIVEQHDRSEETPAEVHWPLGKDRPIIDVEEPRLATGTMSFYVGPARYRRTVALLRRTDKPVTVISPTGWRYSLVFTKRDYDPEPAGFVSISADYVEVQPAVGPG